MFATAGLPKSVEEEAAFWSHDYRDLGGGAFQALATSAYDDVVEWLAAPQDGFGLDFACGSGAFARHLGGRTVVGLDISVPLLSAAKSVIPVQGSGVELPLGSAMFDFATCIAALHHMPEPHRAIRELARVLKPGGIIGIVELNTNHPQRRLVASRSSRARAIFSSTGFSPSEQLIPEAVLLGMLRAVGFEIDCVRYFSPPYREPSVFGRLQAVVSKALGHGAFRKYVESYTFIRASRIP